MQIKLTRILLLFLTTMIFFACKKENTVSPVIIKPPPVDKSEILLRDIIIEKLPTPYYHFTYDENKFITDISFAANLFMYRLTYEENRIVKMQNILNGNMLLYAYNGSNVSGIKEVSGINGQILWRYVFGYNSKEQLQQVRWYQFDETGADSVLMRKVELSYFDDGNLAAYDDYRNFGVQVEWLQKVAFSNYDEGINTDGFGLLKDFFDNLLVLPQVRLQRNNPGASTITGLMNDYTISYVYQYDNNTLPVSKITDMQQTRGSESGARHTFTTQFTYY